METSLSSKEIKLTAILSFIFVLRIFGLFMIFPIFSVAAQILTHSEPKLIGIALGIYGLTQAALQIPFGILSDYLGRKPVIIIGLVIFALASLIASLTNNIYWLIAARALQGAGAIGCVTTAAIADHTRTIVRTKAMAILGASIGCSFVLAVAIGPIIYQLSSLQGIFATTLVLTLLGIFVATYLPSSTHCAPSKLLTKVINLNLLYLNTCGLVLHAIMAALFIILPTSLNNLGFAISTMWQIYVPCITIAILLAAILIKTNKNTIRQHQLFIVNWYIILAAVLLLFSNCANIMMLGLVVFFTAFCVLEAQLPSLVSQQAPENCRGLALGIQSSMQFLGIFLGSVLAGVGSDYSVQVIGWLVAFPIISLLVIALVLYKKRGKLLCLEV